MKSRFFYGVFVGFIVASLFFFFFFRVARAESPKPTPQAHVATYNGYYGGEAGEALYGYNAAANYGRYGYNNKTYASRVDHNYNGTAAAYQYNVAYYEGETYNGYESNPYAIA
jgi:hypothetical protein